MAESWNTPVVIVGGGPVGLAMAIGLRHFGIECTLVEQHLSTLDFPRGRGVNVRTMEILRRGVQLPVARRRTDGEAVRRSWHQPDSGPEREVAES